MIPIGWFVAFLLWGLMLLLFKPEQKRIPGLKDKAIKLFRDVLEKDPSNIECYLYTGNLLREKGEIVRAIKIHKNLLVNPLLTNEQKNRLKEALAEDYLKNRDWAKALPMLETIYHRDPKNTEISNKLMFVYEKLEKWILNSYFTH